MKNTKKYTISSFSNSRGNWALWTYATNENEYKECIKSIENRGCMARVIDRETKKIVYITK